MWFAVYQFQEGITALRIISMKPREVTTGNGQSPVAPPWTPSGRFLDAVSGGMEHFRPSNDRIF